VTTSVCERCGTQLVDDDGASWAYCPNCDWCPDCGVTHPATTHPKHVPERRAWTQEELDYLAHGEDAEP
jgi:hypothetical protein